MTNKRSNSAFKIILGAIIVLSITVIGCNSDSSSSTETKVDTTATDKMMETAPVIIDTAKKMDTATDRPIVPGNKP